MKKQFLLFFALVCSVVSMGQNHKKGGWDISVGPKVYAPIAKNVDWDSKSWGQKVNFSKKNFNLSLGYMQNKSGNAQIPVLLGVRKNLKGNLYVGLGAGLTFFNGQKGQFTYNPSIGYKLNKKWCLEQSIMRMVKDGEHRSQVGLSALFHL